MLTKNDIIEKSKELGIADIGFTTADPFDSQKQVLESRREDYTAAFGPGFDLTKGTDPRALYPEAKSIIVLLGIYFDEAFPTEMEAKYGRFYLMDDRIAQQEFYKHIGQFKEYLESNGVHCESSRYLSDRISAARAGLGTFGKNSLLYANRVARNSSWITPVALMVDQEYAADESTLDVGCPDWCKHACIVACPTRALKGPRHLNPNRCISYLTYTDSGITDRSLREAMGMRIYGCDHCQSVCPRNAPLMAKEKPVTDKAKAMEKDFELSALLHMDKDYFESKVWPRMFYVDYKDVWRWKMNVARAMGNSRDDRYVPDLIRAFREIEDERVQGMIAWALGRIGGLDAKAALTDFEAGRDGLVREEIALALDQF
jgi:epoxyqueuosine reductase